jgi:hypothetical protein
MMVSTLNLNVCHDGQVHQEHWHQQVQGSIDDHEYRKALQVLRDFHLRTPLSLGVIHEDRESVDQLHGRLSPSSIRRQKAARNLQSLAELEPDVEYGLELRGGSEARSSDFIEAGFSCSAYHSKLEPVSHQKPPLAKPSFRSRPPAVWTRW